MMDNMNKSFTHLYELFCVSVCVASDDEMLLFLSVDDRNENIHKNLV